MFLQIIAALCALILTIPCIVFLIAAIYIPRWDYTPSDTFHRLRRFFFRIFAGRALRPVTLDASVPAGTNIRTTSDTNI
jgi:hypothetical protein